MKTILKAKRLWRHFQRGESGRRFQDRYERAQRSRQRGQVWWRAVKAIVGGLAVVIGLVEIVLPGPAILFLLIGGSLLATESKPVAKTMDWLEVRCRQVAGGVRSAWNRISLPAQYALVGLIGAVGIAGVLIAYRVLSD